MLGMTSATAQAKHLAFAVEITAYLLSCMMVEIHARSDAEGQDPDSHGRNYVAVALRAREILFDAAQSRH